MIISNKTGMGLVELCIAMVVAALAIGPMIVSLSATNRMSQTSIYETLAVHYASEICDQIKRLSPRLPALLTDAREVDPAADTRTIFSSLNGQMELYNYTQSVNFNVNGSELNTRILLTPLLENFTRREIFIEEVPDTNSNNILNSGTYWKATVTIAWNDLAAGSDEREINMVVYIHESV